MNVTGTLASGAYQPPATVAAQAVEAVAASPATAVAEAPAPDRAKPLFTGGVLDWDTLMTPETLGALFALDERGEVQFAANGAPVFTASGHPGSVKADLLVLHVKEIHAQEIGDKSGYRLGATDEQKKFFHEVTGYNLVTVNGGYNVLDDGGNVVPDGAPEGGRSSAVWQLAGDIVATNMELDGVPINVDGSPRTGSISVDGEWFRKWSDSMAAGGLDLPPAWMDRARAYFDDALNALFDSDEARQPTDTPAPGALPLESGNAEVSRLAHAAYQRAPMSVAATATTA